MGGIAVTGSVAFDTIMDFPGRFADHILPDQTHVLNVSFLVGAMQRRRGGTAANIAYSLALLGDRPRLCAAVGSDFGDFESALVAAGVDTSAVLHCDDVATGAAFITTDRDNNQITAFYPGAMARSAAIDVGAVAGADTVVVSPDAPDAMAVHIEQTLARGHRLVFAPAQQLPALSDETLRRGLDGAWMVIGNDYEIELIRSRTGRSLDDLAPAVIAVTHGAAGSQLITAEGSWDIPAAPIGTLVDPTGAGDAYIAGLLAGMRSGRPPEVAGRMGALCAAYVVECSGTQEHSFSITDFSARYASSFGDSLA